jgi:hypothetical protein
MTSADPREVRLVVEAGKVAEFRAATGLPPAAHVTVAPPTFPVVLEHFSRPYAAILADEGVDLGRVLHGEERITYPDGPLRVGDNLSGRIEVIDDVTRQGSSGPLRLVTMRVDLARGDGSVAATVERVLVVLGG